MLSRGVQEGKYRPCFVGSLSDRECSVNTTPRCRINFGSTRGLIDDGKSSSVSLEELPTSRFAVQSTSVRFKTAIEEVQERFGPSLGAATSELAGADHSHQYSRHDRISSGSLITSLSLERGGTTSVEIQAAFAFRMQMARSDATGIRM